MPPVPRSIVPCINEATTLFPMNMCNHLHCPAPPQFDIKHQKTQDLPRYPLSNFSDDVGSSGYFDKERSIPLKALIPMTIFVFSYLYARLSILIFDLVNLRIQPTSIRNGQVVQSFAAFLVIPSLDEWLIHFRCSGGCGREILRFASRGYDLDILKSN
jgi:hypothetical protein